MHLGIGIFESGTPPVLLTCEKDEIYINWTNNCTEVGCKSGWWEVINLENNPLNESILRRIDVNTGSVPIRIEFGPTRMEGKILTKVICNDTSFETNHTTRVLRGPYIDCPDTCSVREECRCSVNQCSKGLFLLNNHEDKPLSNNVIEDVNSISFNYTFKAYREGKIEARMRCKEPYFEHEVKYIVISRPGKQFYMSNMACNTTHCSVDVVKNTVEGEASILIQVFEEPQGIIYYTGRVDVPTGETGEKVIPLNKVKDCSEGAELKVLALANTPSERVDRLKDTYTCG